MSEQPRPFTVTPIEDELIGTPLDYWSKGSPPSHPDQRQEPVRDAAVNPQPGDFQPLRPVAGHPDKVMHAEVGTPEYDAAVKAWREANPTA